VYQRPLAAVARAALAAPKPGSGGWYWPVGTEDFQGWSGWLDKRGSYLHVAQDMPCAVGHAVYAIADGAAYWTEEGAAGSFTWREDLASGKRETLGAGEAPPAFDVHRCDTALLASPALGFTVGDHLPLLTLRTAHATPLWGADAELDARLKPGSWRVQAVHPADAAHAETSTAWRRFTVQ